ncbi:MAG: Sulfatase [Hyphomicrobiales bacterium]|nr:Sulfatase [Hyphomicrobiales bacterium]
MHIFTHLKPASEGKTGLRVYPDGMVEHETFTRPDGGTTMFKGKKNTNWEGGYRAPKAIRWS